MCTCVHAGGQTGASLGDCLNFFTGSEFIPPTGFDTECVLNFNSCQEYPTASICGQMLILPSQYFDDYNLFKKKMLYAFMHHGGFGLY